jgi:hypothetical protein
LIFDHQVPHAKDHHHPACSTGADHTAETAAGRIRTQPWRYAPLIDLGGVFVLSPYRPQIDQISARISERLHERGENLESMLAALREAREEYGRQD